MSQTLLPQQDQQKGKKFPLWLKNTLLIGTGFGSGLLTYTIVPSLFHTCITQLSEFIFLIQQPQMANAMQSIDGIMQILGIPFAIYTFCLKRVKTKKAEAFLINQAEKKENQSET